MSFTFFCLFYFTVMGLLLWTSNSIVPYAVAHLYDLIARSLLGLAIIYHIFPFAKQLLFDKRVSPVGKAVLITGCDTGFGYNLAKRLDSAGYHVFACCLYPSGDGANVLKQSCSSSLHVLGLDVRKDDSVKGALDYVKKNLNNSVLWAVVNNAGIAKGLEIDGTKIEDFRNTMDVNAFGGVRVTKAFLPLLQESKGRVITITSLTARTAYAFLSPYSMSKHAISCFCDCLRFEICERGIKVITVEPDFFRTRLTDYDRCLDEYKEELDDEIKNRCDVLKLENYKVFGHKYFGGSKKIYKVIDCLENTVALQEPSNSYRVYRNIFFGGIYYIFESLPQPVKDGIGYALCHVTNLPMSVFQNH